MSDESILGYSMNQMNFINKKSLDYKGIYPCYVSNKVVRKKRK